MSFNQIIKLQGHRRQSPREVFAKLAKSPSSLLTADHYGSGEIVQNFEGRIARLLGKEAGLLFPSGTMAQQIALRIWADRHGSRSVALHPTSHLLLHEQDAFRKLHGLKATVCGSWWQPLTVKDLPSDTDHLAALIVELPQRHSGGCLPRWQDLVDLSRYCRERAIALHLDGARLWECTSYYDRPLAEICALVDSVYVSFYKGLGATHGAMLLGNPSLIEDARVWQRRHGGNLVHMYPTAISASDGLDCHLHRMPSYLRTAKALARLFHQPPLVTCIPEDPQINMFHLRFAKADQIVAEALKAARLQTGLSFGECPTSPNSKIFSTLELYIGDSATELPIDQIKSAWTVILDVLNKT